VGISPVISKVLVALRLDLTPLKQSIVEEEVICAVAWKSLGRWVGRWWARAHTNGMTSDSEPRLFNGVNLSIEGKWVRCGEVGNTGSVRSLTRMKTYQGSRSCETPEPRPTKPTERSLR
jgi:hypothetical protein